MISAQHDENVTLDQLRTDLMEKVVKVVVPKKYLDNETKYHMQPSGKFVIGGPQVFLFSSSFKSMAVHLIKKCHGNSRLYETTTVTILFYPGKSHLYETTIILFYHVVKKKFIYKMFKQRVMQV